MWQKPSTRKFLVFLLLILLAGLIFVLSHGDETNRIRDQRDLKSGEPVSSLFGGIQEWYRQVLYRWKVPELYRDIPKPPQYSRAIVIGSGFGGAISALRLGQAGIQTTVLERGQDWPIDKRRDIHTSEPLSDGRGVWSRTKVHVPLASPNGIMRPVDRFGGVLDVTEYDNIEVWRGALVGGGSKVFTGVMIQPIQEYFEAVFGETVSFDEMNEVYYPRVRQMLNLSPIPNDILESKPFGHSRVWEQQVTSAGYTAERPDSLFNWDVVRDELEGRSKKSATAGKSDMGNSNGAKFDVTQNYLKDAKATGLINVFPNQLVKDIRQTSSGLYQVDIEKLSPSGRVIDHYSIEGDYLFLAAGSIGTTELLVKAKAKNSVAGLNDEIGLGWGTNGDSIVTRSFNPIRGLTQASPCASRIHDPDGPLPITFESWFVAAIPTDIGIQGTLGIALDLENRGQFVYDSGRDEVKLVWPETGNDLAESAARRLNDIIAEQGQPKSIPGVLPFAPDVWAGFTAHPLGGAVIGKATDNYGRVAGANRLYVMDGAAIPGSTGAVNPSLTISALAERNIERIISEDFS